MQLRWSASARSPARRGRGTAAGARGAGQSGDTRERGAALLRAAVAVSGVCASRCAVSLEIN
eukprot:scaffold89872_cov90-Phaeocystis_antarctica.AAC.3